MQGDDPVGRWQLPMRPTPFAATLATGSLGRTGSLGGWAT
jgi:hypothetical protein